MGDASGHAAAFREVVTGIDTGDGWLCVQVPQAAIEVATLRSKECAAAELVALEQAEAYAAELDARNGLAQAQPKMVSENWRLAQMKDVIACQTQAVQMRAERQQDVPFVSLVSGAQSSGDPVLTAQTGSDLTEEHAAIIDAMSTQYNRRV